MQTVCPPSYHHNTTMALCSNAQVHVYITCSLLAISPHFQGNSMGSVSYFTTC